MNIKRLMDLAAIAACAIARLAGARSGTHTNARTRKGPAKSDRRQKEVICETANSEWRNSSTRHSPLVFQV